MSRRTYLDNRPRRTDGSLRIPPTPGRGLCALSLSLSPKIVVRGSVLRREQKRTYIFIFKLFLPHWLINFLNSDRAREPRRSTETGDPPARPREREVVLFLLIIFRLSTSFLSLSLCPERGGILSAPYRRINIPARSADSLKRRQDGDRASVRRYRC